MRVVVRIIQNRGSPLPFIPIHRPPGFPADPPARRVLAWVSRRSPSQLSPSRFETLPASLPPFPSSSPLLLTSNYIQDGNLR